MKIAYSFFIYIYGGLISIVSLFNKKAHLLSKGQGQCFKVLKESIDSQCEYVWFHAASLGEFEQGRPVMEQIKTEQPNTKILLTFFSPSGYEVRKNYGGADVICYLPLDTPSNAKRFLKMVNVSKAIYIKYEFWPNFLLELQNNNIPVYSISSIFRPNQVFFRWFGGWYMNILRTFKHIFVQDDFSNQLLISHDIQNVTVAGDTRFDRVVDVSKKSKSIAVVQQFIGNCQRVIVAGSSWPKDEELLIRYLNEHVDVKLILVPHEIHEAHLLGIFKMLNNNYVRYTQANVSDLQTSNCLVVDTIGLLSSIYQYADIAYIGGGFGVGIHNTLEAAVWRIPVVFGSNFQKFREARELISAGGAFSVADYDLLKIQLDKLFDDKKAGEIAGDYVKTNTGATGLILKYLM